MKVAELREKLEEADLPTDVCLSLFFSFLYIFFLLFRSFILFSPFFLVYLNQVVFI
jgi:hypothetical protein